MVCDNGAADIMLVIDTSASMKNYGVEVMKQLADDLRSMLPMNQQFRIGMISYAVDVVTVFDFTNSPNASAVFATKFTGNAFLSDHRWFI